MTLSRRRTSAVLTASAALFVAPLAPLAQATTDRTAADSTRYVALGDSYAAGVGAFDSRVAGCYRSGYSYPAVLAAAAGLSLDQQACSGAKTGDVLSNQLRTLSAQTGKVSITVGGNDAGFAPVMTECALPGWLSNCSGKMGQAAAHIANVLPASLTTTYAAVRAGAPNAQVVVTGYPRLFNGVDCSLLTFFSASEMSSLNGLADQLDTLIAAKSAAAGFRFVDPRGAFAGHAVCSSDPWINNATSPIIESYHPNRAGHAAYSRLVGSGFGLAAGMGGVADRSDTRATRVPTAAQYRAAVPGLATPVGLRKAAAAGLDVALIKRLDAALRSGNLVRARAAAVTLHRLDAQVAARRARS